MRVIPAIRKAEVEESLEPRRRGGCSELRSRHCTPAWATRARLHLKKQNKTKQQQQTTTTTTAKIYIYIPNNFCVKYNLLNSPFPQMCNPVMGSTTVSMEVSRILLSGFLQIWEVHVETQRYKIKYYYTNLMFQTRKTFLKNYFLRLILKTVINTLYQFSLCGSINK